MLSLKDILTVLLGLVGVILGLYWFLRGFRLLQQKTWIEDTPVIKIGGAAIGMVKIFGTAVGPYTLISPLAQVDCYYYRAVARQGREAEREDQPEGTATETIFAPFFVEDETGRLMIDPRGAQLDLPAEYEEEVSGESMAERTRRFLRRHGLSTHGETMVSEYAIKPGDPLLVVGTVQEIGTENGPEKIGCAYLSFEAADLQRREQLEATGAAIEGRSTSTEIDDTFELHPDTVLCRGDRRQPFLLSRENPQRVIDNLDRSAVIRIWGGPPLALISLFFLLKALRAW